MSTIKAAYSLPAGVAIEIAQGDITKEPVDAIVNAANLNLAHGGGVAAAIVRAGGEVIQEESDAWVREYGTVSNDAPAYTSAGKLPCRYVIHAVGPIWGEGEEDRKLEEAITGCLRLCERLNLQSVAFPAISTGIFGFPKHRAARVFFQTFAEYFAENPATLPRLVRLTLWDDETVGVFLSAAEDAFGPAE